jgi:hypothetical protein
LVPFGLPKGNTAGAIEQEIIYGEAHSATNGSEPIKSVFDRPIYVAGDCVEASAAFEVCPRRIGFEPKYKGVQLIVESDLAPREPAVGVDLRWDGSKTTMGPVPGSKVRSPSQRPQE